ncbi:metallophosphoesterase [Pediococcus acidilactici]|uniref:Metallophosphoesterase n=1 Tax=Pediococcus acidilactici TaxID=1254 RepID=A0AAW8YKN3_PEDAC|nr:metallophosphoesterase [Pediococcus acidilactici]MDV2911018.1 metallophosphoesterase [Pediococcus acidilactici]WQS17658.1 metallophosphoesterase [Pediococcus acidilactici]
MAALITLDTYKQMIKAGEAFNIAESFNARVGDEQVPLAVKFLERGKAQQFEDGLVPFMSGFVGNLDEKGRVTAETGVPVSYTGTRSDIVGLGMVKMNLPGTMFPQEGYFYGFLGLETPDHSKRVSTFSVWFHVYNGNPDMFVNKEPFRSDLQKLMDEAEIKIEAEIGNVQKEWKTLSETIQKMIEQGDTDLTSLKNRIGLAEDELADLLKTIDDKGLLTQDEFSSQMKIFEQNFQDALEKLQSPIPIDDSVIIGKPVPSNVKNALDMIKSTIDQSKFNLLFFNDSHYGMRSAITNYGPLYGIDRLNGALYMDDSVDAIVAGGDNIDGHLNSTAGLLNDEQNFALELLFGSANHSDKFALRGNHDDGTLRLRNYRLGIQPSPDYFPDTISEQQFKQHYMIGNLLFDEHRNNGDSLYFYKDYPDKKVRLIGLNSNDTPEDIKDSDGGVKYIGISNMGYRQEQLDWLANVALQNVPEDYATIVVVHAQATPTENDDTDLSDGMKDHHTNQKQVVQILNDFKNGQSSVVTNNVKDWEVNVKTNFVTQGKRDLVAWIHGHLHYEEFTTSNGFNDISCISSIDVKGFQYEDDGGWTLFTLDPANRKLIATGYGLGTNRTFTY